MKNKVINSEQVKAEKFFNRLWKGSAAKAISWFLTGIFLFILMILNMIPVQAIFEDDTPLLMSATQVMTAYLMIYFRSMIYDNYNENQKSRRMADILKYHPINRKEVWKHKTKNIALFLAKVTGVGVGFQIFGALIGYQSISWLNFFYAFVFNFVFPMAGLLTSDSIAKKIGE